MKLQQKLYTEEQVRKAIDFFLLDEIKKDKILETLTPVELASDEVISQEFKHSSDEWEIRQALEKGAKWMREQIVKTE